LYYQPKKTKLPASNKSRSGFHEAICTLRLKFALCDHPFLQNFALIWHHAFELFPQLIAFSARFGCALTFNAVQLTVMKSTLVLRHLVILLYHKGFKIICQLLEIV
jgi:hypothetical protein